MRPFYTLMEEALRLHGYEVTADAALEGRSGTIYTAPLLAERDGGALVVDARGADEAVDHTTVQDLAAVVADVGADLGILCHLGEADEDSAAAGGGRVLLWDRSVLVEVVGQGRLADATGHGTPELPLHQPRPVEVPEALTDLLPEAFRDVHPGAVEAPVGAHGSADAPAADTAPSSEAEGAPGLDLLEGEAPGSALRSLDGPVPQEEAGDGMQESAVPADAPGGGEAASPDRSGAQPPGDFPAEDGAAQQTPPVPLDGDAPSASAEAAQPAPEPARPALGPCMPLDQAVRRVRDRLFEVQGARLILHPVHIYAYECDLLVEGSLRYETVSGRIQVDGSRGHAVEADASLGPDCVQDLSPPPGVAVEERELRTREEKALRLARDLIVHQHTRLISVEVTDDDGSYSYSEKRRVAPQEDHVRLEHLGVHHRPLWRLWGPNGHLDLDGLTGYPVEQALRNPNPDILVVD